MAELEEGERSSLESDLDRDLEMSPTPPPPSPVVDTPPVLAPVFNGEQAKRFVFRSKDARRLLRNKHIVVIGDSIQRGVYKDLVLFLQEDRLLEPRKELKAKCEGEFINDRCVFRTEQTTGKEFFECREFQSFDGCHLVQYYFITRCYYDKLEGIIQSWTDRDEMPDLILMNSCMWDISRYDTDQEEHQEEEYKNRMRRLLTRLSCALPPTTTFLWLASLPLASKINCRAWLSEELQTLEGSLRLSVLEANNYVMQLMMAYGFNVLDLNFYLRPLMNKHREPDGVHWNPIGHRHITELILTFLSDSWGVPLPEYSVEVLKTTNMETDLRHFFEDLPSCINDQIENLDELREEALLRNPELAAAADASRVRNGDMSEQSRTAAGESPEYDTSPSLESVEGAPHLFDVD